ncbi:MAG: ABC transporter ATP-binding protein [bacterium]|nr:ABC transporter ATP-binding protein [bacterium]
MNSIIDVNGLVKTYDKFSLDNVSFTIPPGKIVGLIGENGAGKTTLIKCLLKIIEQDNGKIKLFAKDTKYIDDIKNDIGIVLDNSFFPELLCGNDINNIMKNIYKNWDSPLFNEYLTKFNIDKKQNIKTLSKGMRKKLELATALSHKPKLLILDEPTSGLDPVVRAEVLDIFNDFVSNNTNSILLSTHITSDLENIADDIIFIDEGKIVLNDTRKNLLNNYAIIKGGKDIIKDIEESYVVGKRKCRDGYELLVNNKKIIMKKNKNININNASLEDIMVIYIKGDK